MEDFRIDRLFSETVATVCEGTIFELLSSHRMDLSIDHYLERINYKTACLISACCKGGAIVGGGTDAQIALMTQYGVNLGIAFQIVDDILDYTGSPTTIGKPTGNDLRQGLVTLPLLYALRNEQNGRVERVERIMNQKKPSDAEIDTVVRWVNATNAISESLELARHYAARATALLSEFPASPERAVLMEVVDFVVERSR